MIPSILLVGLLALSITSVIPFTRANPIPGNDTSLAVRQYGIFDHHNDCCKTNCKLEPAKGKTKTIWKFEQLTAWNDAGDGAAEVAFTESYTSSYTISGGFNVGFISAGLDVTESWTTGKTYTCIGAPMKKVCVWMRVPHRVYAVAAPQDAKICGLDGSTEITAPIIGSENGGFYCVRGDACRSKGSFYWCQPGIDC